MRAVRYITAHRGDAESFRRKPLFQGIGEREPLFAKLNNTEGLSKVYNRYLDRHFEEFESFGTQPADHDETDILVFVHDDVEVIGNNAAYELNRWADQGYAILGLAGGSRALIKPPTLWHLMTEKGAHSGNAVFHIAKQNPTTGRYQTDREQPFPSRYGPYGDVVMLDGLFLAVVQEAVNRVGWRFDDRFAFHHYDIASCLRAHAAGLKLRTVFLPVVHWPGRMIEPDDPEFLQSERIFLEAYAAQGPVAYWC